VDGHKAAVQLLVMKQADLNVNCKDEDGRTMLSYAVAYGHKAVVELLLAKDGVDPDFKDSGRRTLLP
jgi:ankyrin repeat protein